MWKGTQIIESTSTYFNGLGALSRLIGIYKNLYKVVSSDCLFWPLPCQCSLGKAFIRPVEWQVLAEFTLQEDDEHGTFEAPANALLIVHL